jgi:hypothetical protein
MPLGRVSPGPYRLEGHGHLHLKWIRSYSPAPTRSSNETQAPRRVSIRVRVTEDSDVQEGKGRQGEA